MSQNFNQEFVNMEIWNLFRKRFRSKTSEGSYRSDIMEFCRLTGKPFTESTKEDVRDYYVRITEQVKAGKISSITRTKKFRELHSFGAFLIEQGLWGRGTEEDYFYPYLKNMKKEGFLAGAVPVEDMDALLRVASKDLMAYTILVLMYRAGLTSTEITAITGADDFLEYEDGIYITLKGREQPCYIPQDAWKILKLYMDQRDEHETLFYNRNGRPLNTMYISRMMKKYCDRAGIRGYSAQEVRNSCAFNLFAYGADAVRTAEQMGRTTQQIRRYNGARYKANLRRKASDLVKIHIEEP